MRKSAIVFSVFMAFAAASCSDGESEPTEGGGSGAESCDAPVETATIQIADLAFDPTCVQLPAGTASLSVQNNDNTDHTFTISDVDLNEDIDPGEDAGVDVSALPEGAYPFRCTIHPQMTGVLTI